MASTLTLERVNSDIDVLSRAGLDVATFVAEVDQSLERAIPHVAACMCTVDPATHLLTGTYKFGDLYGNDEHDLDWGLQEYSGVDPSNFPDLFARNVDAVSVHRSTGGDVAASPRLERFLNPLYGYADELRMVGRNGDVGWGGMALFRGPDDAPFTEHEVTFVASLSERFAAGLRSGLLVRLASAFQPGRPEADHRPAEAGPAVAIVDSANRLLQVSVGAARLLEEMTMEANRADASGTIASLIAGARRYVEGTAEVLPRGRVRLPSGRWIVLHASPLSGSDGRSGDVVITMEEARPPEIVPLVVAAFGLTDRERDVTRLVLQGADTKEIATTLHVSRYTVQDHLKSVFDKADVRSRRELVSRVFFDQYSPRLGGDLAPSGWFATEVGPSPEATART
ncbi:MAG: helix-turn-helix transcriptional regulator [Microthrixaceae bacterium]